MSSYDRALRSVRKVQHRSSNSRRIFLVLHPDGQQRVLGILLSCEEGGKGALGHYQDQKESW